MNTTETILRLVEQILEESNEKFKLNDREVERTVQIEDKTNKKNIVICWGRNDTPSDWDGVSRSIKVTIAPA